MFWEHARWITDDLKGASLHLQTKASWLLSVAVVGLAFLWQWMLTPPTMPPLSYALGTLAATGWLATVISCLGVLRLGMTSSPYYWFAKAYAASSFHREDTGQDYSQSAVYRELISGLIGSEPEGAGVAHGYHDDINRRGWWFKWAVRWTLGSICAMVFGGVAHIAFR